jgi:4-coumarate--CoA ligase (photoactive yellow protein activation family)
MTFDRARYEALLPEIIADLVLAELRARQPNKFAELTIDDIKKSDDWRSDFSLDSMDRMALASSCAEFFNVYDSGREDTLLGKANVLRWTEVVALAQRETSGNITFRSSGTTGQAKHFRHRAAWLDEEVAHWCEQITLASRTRIVTHVPLHHVYGYLWGAMLSSVSALPLVRQSAMSLSPPRLLAGDVLITTPHLLEAWLARGVVIDRDVIAVTSTGRFVQSTHTAACDSLRVNAVWEIYGSSETAGLGIRKSGEETYTWLPYWTPRITGLNDERRNIISAHRLLDNTAVEVALPDSIECAESPQRFIVGERNDDVVKISGHRIDLNEVRALLKQIPSVSDANVRATNDGDKHALKVFLVRNSRAQSDAQFIDAAKAWLQMNWLHASAVSQWTLGNEVPRNAIGKLTDW